MRRGVTAEVVNPLDPRFAFAVDLLRDGGANGVGGGKVVYN